MRLSSSTGRTARPASLERVSISGMSAATSPHGGGPSLQLNHNSLVNQNYRRAVLTVRAKVEASVAILCSFARAPTRVCRTKPALTPVGSFRRRAAKLSASCKPRIPTRSGPRRNDRAHCTVEAPKQCRMTRFDPWAVHPSLNRQPPLIVGRTACALIRSCGPHRERLIEHLQ
jgi:hypothetical protein